jgi:anti-sigma B factor antagonist
VANDESVGSESIAHLAVAVCEDATTVTVAPAGDVDLATGTSLDTAITTAVTGAGDRAVVVDLSAVTFLDSSGIALLVHGRRLAETSHVPYRVAGAHGVVREVLDLTGVWALLAEEPS